jgi:hypothetical protein
MRKSHNGGLPRPPEAGYFLPDWIQFKEKHGYFLSTPLFIHPENTVSKGQEIIITPE